MLTRHPSSHGTVSNSRLQCYVGKNRLENAIKAYKQTVPGGSDDTFTITWHPFYLDPSLPKKGVDPEAHLGNKYGLERTKMMRSRIRTLAAAEGLPFKSEGKIGNTRDAHRLLQLAKSKSLDVQNRTVAELFRSHFEEGGDVTSWDMLIAAAEKAGLDRGEAKKWLEEGTGGEEVDREVQEAYRQEVHGVPNFTIQGKYQLEGAQDPETFVRAFVLAKAAAEDVSGSSEQGPTC